MDLLYELENVEQVYGGRVVLKIERLVIEQGEIIGVYGPNGSGKSTLLKLLALLESPARGAVRFMGRVADIHDLQLRRKVTLLSQSPYLLKRSVLSNILYGLKVRGRTGGREKAYNALEMVGLDPQEFAGRKWHELSGGEAQRVALAARLVLEPEVLILDEPTAYLDEDSTEKIRSAALFANREWGSALVLVSHDYQWLRSACKRIFRMSRGSITRSES